MNHNARRFINTDDIIDYLIPKRNVLEKPEFNIPESHSNNNESNKGSRNHEVKAIGDPKQGGKTSNVVRTESDVEPKNETNVGDACNGYVSPNKADIINDDKNHEKEHEHQIISKLKESDSDIDPAKIIMVKIVIEKKELVGYR